MLSREILIKKVAKRRADRGNSVTECSHLKDKIGNTVDNKLWEDQIKSRNFYCGSIPGTISV